MAVIYFRSHSVNAVSSNKMILHDCFSIQNSIVFIYSYDLF